MSDTFPDAPRPPAPEHGSGTTLGLIAREANVSIGTVSKVLNGRKGISPATRARVEELMELHGYSRRGAERPHGALIEIVLEVVDTGFSVDLLRGVSAVARENGLSVIVTEHGRDTALDGDWMAGVMQRRPMGLVLVFSDLAPAQKRQLRSRGIPFVVVDPAGSPAADVPSVGSTNWEGGHAAGEHLLGLGHRRIGAISGPPHRLYSRARMSGFRSALEAAGSDVSLVEVEGDFGRAAGHRAGGELLDRAERPTAIFAGNDEQAVGLYEAARERGIRIPDDLSVLGYDDLPFARIVSPALSTVRQPVREMAEAAARMVLRIREGRSEEPTRLDLATALVVRASTAAPAAADAVSSPE
ncbi:LacI family DNA-binding transcriptional regulator [Clavibacter michiganensis]|uniref:LacI family DNA-binding transcriptional regulator n=1 Tax=Clavibacter michiganensis TaxID=28447 RepID=UPI003EBF6EB5